MAISESSFPERQSRHNVDRIYTEARLYIGIGCLIVGPLFTYFIWTDIPIADGLTNANYAYVQAIALWAYYISWLLGTPFDASYQKWVFESDGAEPGIRVQSILLVAFLISAAVIFLKFRNDEQLFAAAFTTFIVINLAGWIWILHITRSIKETSETILTARKDYIGLSELNVVMQHIRGSWQVWRFGGMFLLLMCLVVVSFFSGARANAAKIIHQTLSVVPSFSGIPAGVISSLLPDALLIGFILFAEGIIWYKRMKVRACINLLELLGNSYRLMPISD